MQGSSLPLNMNCESPKAVPGRLTSFSMTLAVLYSPNCQSLPGSGMEMNLRRQTVKQC